MEAAKVGDEICWPDGEDEDLSYISGPDAADNICYSYDGKFFISISSNFRMAPLCWVEGKPVYKGDVLYLKDMLGSIDKFVAQSFDGEKLWSNTGWMPSGSLFCNPPKWKREVKLFAYLDADQLFWLREAAAHKFPAVRVPSEDKTVEVEDAASA